jgi:hypothetical protein
MRSSWPRPVKAVTLWCSARAPSLRSEEKGAQVFPLPLILRIVSSGGLPQIKKWSIVTMMVKKLLRQTPGRPQFRFRPGTSNHLSSRRLRLSGWLSHVNCAGGEPEDVDYVGAKVQVDAARAKGVKHFVVVGSMVRTTLVLAPEWAEVTYRWSYMYWVVWQGGTQPANFLNVIGPVPPQMCRVCFPMTRYIWSFFR